MKTLYVLALLLAAAAPAAAQQAKSDAYTVAYRQLLTEANDRVATLSDDVARLAADNKRLSDELAALKKAAAKAPEATK